MRQLLRKEFILKPSYLSLLEALCSVSDGQAVPHQQNRVFEEFISKHGNLLLKLRLSSRTPADVIKEKSSQKPSFNALPGVATSQIGDGAFTADGAKSDHTVSSNAWAF